MGTNHIEIELHDDATTAPNYKNLEEVFRRADIDKAVIIKSGTVCGNSTVDIQFSDELGNKFVGMITARLLKAIVDMCITTNKE